MSKGMGCLGFGALVIAGLLAVGLVTGRDGDPDTAAPAEAASDPRRADPRTALTLAQVRGEKGGFESVFLLSGVLANAADFPIKDVVLTCDLTAPSGTRVGRVSATLYEIVPAHGRKAFRRLNMGFMGSGQVARFSCGATRAAAG